jgi:lipopolysaccharide transport system permease protein
MNVASAGVGKLGYLQHMWKLRHFLFSLVFMDLRTRYRRSVLGMGWSFFRPLAMTVVFCLVFGSIFNMPVEQYAPFLFCGLCLWQFIMESSQIGCHCFHMASGYIRQQPVPLALFPLRVVMGAGMHAGLAFLLMLVVVFTRSGLPDVTVVFGLLIGLVILFIFCWCLAVILGLMHTHFPDTQYLMEVVFQVIFYLTPIVYPPEIIRGRQRFAFLVDMNPMTHLLEIIRRPALVGELAPLHSYLVAVGFVAAFVGVAILFLRKMERNLVFWV